MGQGGSWGGGETQINTTYMALPQKAYNEVMETSHEQEKQNQPSKQQTKKASRNNMAHKGEYREIL